MKKQVLIILTVLFLSSGLAMSTDEARLSDFLVKNHGANLGKASFYLRYGFEKQTGVKWEMSTFNQRKEYLDQYYEKKTKQEKSDRLKEKGEYLEQKQRAKDKKAEEKRLEDAKRAEERRLKKELRAAQIEKKAFDRKVRKRDEQLKESHKVVSRN